MAFIEGFPEDIRLCLIFDEIEYIVSASKLASHWGEEFIPFWQTIWSTQSQYRKFSFIVAGVNASITEIEKVDGIQNPLFGIVKTRYLTGFERSEVNTLVSVLGRRMGLRFDQTAVDALYIRYGGHPLLTRMICSQINNGFKVTNELRPITVTSSIVNKDLLSKEEEVQFYCGHITSQLEEFYPDEYYMLEMLAADNIVDFNEHSNEIELVRHLKSYGLVDFSRPFIPLFKIPVIKGYIASKWRKKNGLNINRYIVPLQRRNEFVAGRVASIIREMRMAERKFSSLSLPKLYGGGGVSEAEEFARSEVCKSRSDFVVFINQSNRSIVEPLDRMGKKLNIDRYFFNNLKNSYHSLWGSFNRIRTYRNFYVHTELNRNAEESFQEFLRIDLDGNLPDKCEDGWFQLQSSVLNGLLIGLQAEMAVYD